MSAPQLTDPGTSSEWFRAVEGAPAGAAAERRRRLRRMVTYTMLGLTAFSVLGLASFAWRRHSLRAELEAAPPPALAVAPQVAAVAAPPAAAAPPATEASVPVPAPPVVAPAAKPVAARSTTTKAKATSSAKKSSNGAFLKAAVAAQARKPQR